jgi:hypothetical protein
MVHDGHNAGIGRDHLWKEGETGFASAAPPDQISRTGSRPVQANEGVPGGRLVAIDGLYEEHALAGELRVFDGGVEVPDDAAEIHEAS